MQETSPIHAEKGLANDMMALVFTENPLAMLILDEHDTILRSNFAFNTLTGCDEIDLLGKHISLFESPKNETLLYDAGHKNTMQSGQGKSCEMHFLCKNDVHILVRQHSKNIVSEGQKYTLLTFQDITEEKRILEHYKHQSTHDPLTGLANRILLNENFKKAKQRAIRTNQRMALLVCDINEFKQFNDSHGHDLGDNILKVVAKTLVDMLRANDSVARYGGDEFVVILEDIGHNHPIDNIITKIKDAFPMSCINGEKEYKINMSIGCAYFPDEGYSFNELVQIADENMYEDKKRFYSFD